MDHNYAATEKSAKWTTVVSRRQKRKQLHAKSSHQVIQIDLEHNYAGPKKQQQTPDMTSQNAENIPTVVNEMANKLPDEHNTDVILNQFSSQLQEDHQQMDTDPVVIKNHNYDTTDRSDGDEMSEKWTTVVGKKHKRKRNVPQNDISSAKHLKRTALPVCQDKADQHPIISLPDLNRVWKWSTPHCINNKIYKQHNVPGDGDCLFHSLSLALHGHLGNTGTYRTQICQNIHGNWQEYQHDIHLHHDKAEQTLDGYCRGMVTGHKYATRCEIAAASKILHVNLTLVLMGENEEHETCYNVENLHGQNGPTITLLLANNHFSVLQEQTNNLTVLTDTSIHLPTDTNSPDSTTSINMHIDQEICTSKSHVAKTSTLVNASSKSRKTQDPRILRVNQPKMNTTVGVQQANTAEDDLLLQSRKLGVSLEVPASTNSETTKEKKLRRQRNVRKMKKQAEALSISDFKNIPNPPPSSDNEQVNNAMDSIRAFELEQMAYSFKSCNACQEVRLNPKMTGPDKQICHRCQKDKEPVKMFSKQNKMDPGKMPQELTDLTMVEQQLISRIAPCINVHMLSHGGIAANGHCVTFPQAIEEPAKIFPKLPSEINLIKVRKQGKNDTSKSFIVRRYRVQSALQWLKCNNPSYSDIIICEDRLRQLPVDGDIHIHTVEYDSKAKHLNDQGPAPEQINPGDVIDTPTTSGVLLPEPSVDIRKKVQEVVEEAIGPEHGEVTANKRGTITIPWPSRNNIPISEFTTHNFFTLAFPTLFPYGSGDFCMNRPRTCASMAEWAEHLIWYEDGRFARHQFFKFIVHNMIMRKRALENCSFIIQQKLGDEQLTVSDLKEKLQKGDQSFVKKILYFGACLRGTSQYWAQRSRDLQALIQYQANEGNGLPSFFATGSCAEYYFKPLRRLLKLYIKQTRDKDVDLDDKTKLFHALQENTHIVGTYFDLRTQSYFDKVMQPVFGVHTYWYRQEFAKSRGMIHWHGLCWRSDREPHQSFYEAVQKGMSDDECAQQISDWAKSVFGMTATHPAGKNSDGTPRKDLWPPPEGTAPKPHEEKNPLVKLLMDVSASQEMLLEDHLLLTNRVSLHRCSDYCLRTQRGHTNDRRCRMEFGTESAPGKVIRDMPAIVKDHNKCLRLEMERDHPTMVQHSRYHTQAWRANGDISIILSKSTPDNPSVQDIIATQRYVSGYACKGNEPTGAIADLFSDMVNTADDDNTAKSMCTKLLMQTVKRDISAVEATFELSALPLYRCSHQFQSVSMSGSRVLEKTGKTLTKSTPLDKYIARNAEDTSSWYRFICSTGRIPVVAGSNMTATWPLNEEYCRTTLLLHWPNWRKIENIKTDEETWTEKMEHFIATQNCPNFVKADIERAKKKEQHESFSDNEDEDGDNGGDSEQQEWMDLIRPNVEYEDLGDFQYDDGGPDYDWSASSNQYPESYGVNWLKEITEDLTEHEMERNELNLPNIDILSMNQDQRLAFNIIMKTLIEYKNNPTDFTSHLRLIVAGTAGSGKSFLIKALVKAIRMLFKRNKAVQVVCPTGSSANNISGVTIHRFLKVPTNYNATKEMVPPDGCQAASLQKNCEGLAALIVDERSLVGATTLGWMEYLCSYGLDKQSTAKKSWGGLPVVVFLGDDIQLPPVCDSPVYRCKSTIPAAMHGALIWKEFTNSVTLRTLMRQNPDEKQFTEVLSAMRQSQVTTQQAQWLQNYQWNNLKASNGEELLQRMSQQGLFVFPTHEQESNHNKAKLKEANEFAPIAKIKAKSQGNHKNVPSDKAGGLLPMLYLCKGAKVMLTSNLNVELGLFNGSMGIVQDIIYLNGKSPTTDLPDVVMVEFTKYTGPTFIKLKPKLVPIVPVERKIDCRCFACKRIQIPLRLGWGTTIHRCQGMTIGDNEANRYIIINPGTRSFESKNPGALYVALSRAKSAGHQSKDPDFAWHPQVLVNEDRLCHTVQTPTTSARTLEIKRIETLTQDTENRFKLQQGNSYFYYCVNLLSQITEE